MEVLQRAKSRTILHTPGAICAGYGRVIFISMLTAAVFTIVMF
jgi:hypothetical protein